MALSEALGRVGEWDEDVFFDCRRKQDSNSERPLFVGLATPSVAACVHFVHFLIKCSTLTLGCQVF